MKKINEILAVVILSLMAVLVAAVGLRIYDSYLTNSEMKTQIRKQEEILSRNREANERVREMQQEIQELSGDREKLQQFLEEIRIEDQETVPAAAMQGSPEPWNSGMSGDASMSENMLSVSEDTTAPDMSENAEIPGESENTLSMSGNDTMSGNDMMSGNSTMSENGLSMSDNSTMSENGLSMSDNSTMSGNGLSMSDNSTMSGNGLSMSDNSTMSGNGLSMSDNSTMSGNGTMSGNTPDPFAGLIGPEITLEERRQIRSSLEETFVTNMEDQRYLENRRTDFSDKKIACLGDSITAAANLEDEENYLSYAYPAVLGEVLGADEVYNLGIGGSSIGRYWADAFVERYKSIPEDTDIIIVMGGTNDGFCLSKEEFGTLSERKPWTFCGDLDELMRGLRENYPDAEIYFVTPLPNILQDYLMRERDYLLPQRYLVNVILTLSAEYDYHVIDLYNSNILDSHDADIVSDYVPDGVHASKEGYRILAEHIAAEVVRSYEE